MSYRVDREKEKKRKRAKEKKKLSDNAENNTAVASAHSNN